MEKYLWEDLKTPEQLFSASLSVIEELRKLPDAGQPPILDAITLMQVICERLKTQNDQMIALASNLSEEMDYFDLIEVLFKSGVNRSEMVSCWDIPAEDAIAAEKQAKEREAANNG